MKKLNFILMIFTLAIYSCTKILDIELPQEQSKLVVNSIIIADSAWKIQLLSTKSIQLDSNNYSFIENAKVEIYSNEELITRPRYIGNGIYSSNDNLPEEGKVYTLKVQANGFPSAQATDTVPRKLIITNDSVSGPYQGDSKYYYYAINYNLPQDTVSYFGLACRSWTEKKADSTTWYNSNFIPISYITPGGITNQHSSFTIFSSNNEFGRNGLSIEAVSDASSYQSGFLVKFYQYYYLVNYSYAYFQYFKSLAVYEHDDFLIEEKAPVFSNIKGGYGIFAAKNMGVEQLFFYWDKNAKIPIYNKKLILH